ncbi:MAG: glycerol kinase GlpK [Butyrivibrio sp.]|nr:glycerol kinase GlpK [Butyrivibrio sp.]
MEERYLVSIDQSTQGTKALLFDKKGTLMCRADEAHEQIINEKGWVSHNPDEIYENVIKVIKKVLIKANVSPEQIIALGISNQRETSVIWDRATGHPLNNAIVWQCARAKDICERPQIKEKEDYIFKTTGLKLSPYFPAAKIAWLLENTENLEKAKENVCHGTVDSYLIYRLTGCKKYATDYSNASRTQLYDIFNFRWDETICELFGINAKNMPEVQDSNSCFGYTDLEGFFSKPIPIYGVMGDSHAALYGQNCRENGQTKATYGTGSSIMMNIGDKKVLSKNGLVTSLAWGIDGKVQYVLEGNLNYTGAVISWLKNDMEMIQSPADTQELANKACKNDSLYIVPAFTGLGAPYWNPDAKAAIVGMDRKTKRAEIVRASLECIAYQITDILKSMSEDSGIKLSELRVDGGPTRNEYLMQFQSDIAKCRVMVPAQEELSGIGVAYMAGLSACLWDESIFEKMKRKVYSPAMDDTTAKDKYEGWLKAVGSVNQ